MVHVFQLSKHTTCAIIFIKCPVDLKVSCFTRSFLHDVVRRSAIVFQHSEISLMDSADSYMLRRMPEDSMIFVINISTPNTNNCLPVFHMRQCIWLTGISFSYLYQNLTRTSKGQFLQCKVLQLFKRAMKINTQILFSVLYKYALTARIYLLINLIVFYVFIITIRNIFTWIPFQSWVYIYVFIQIHYRFIYMHTYICLHMYQLNQKAHITHLIYYNFYQRKSPFIAFMQNSGCFFHLM